MNNPYAQAFKNMPKNLADMPYADLLNQFVNVVKNSKPNIIAELLEEQQGDPSDKLPEDFSTMKSFEICTGYPG